MPELVGFQTMVILDPYGMTFDAVGVFGLVFWLLFKSDSSYCIDVDTKLLSPRFSQKLTPNEFVFLSWIVVKIEKQIRLFDIWENLHLYNFVLRSTDL